ncbi:MAG: FAD-binding oxidoreductase [Albidovulum sp.]|nr:FAD-binding oxidoreductase [Albidovulum sp.]
MTRSPNGYPLSWYAASADIPPPYGSLDADAMSDICIIGGGYTGLSAALHLAERGYSVLLAEKERVGFGASGRNGGQVGSGQRLDQLTLENRVGEYKARQFWLLAEEAKDLVAHLIDRHRIACCYKPGIVTAAWSDKEAERAREYARHLEARYGYKNTQPLDRKAIFEFTGSGAFAGGFADWGAGHLHPLDFAIGLAKAASSAGARIHESTAIRSIVDQAGSVLIKTRKHQIKCDKAIVACNGYIEELNETIKERVAPINNFIIATEPLGAVGPSVLPSGTAVFDTRFVVSYFRKSHDGRMLFGGGENYRSAFPDDIASLVRKPMAKVFPQLDRVAIDYTWGGKLAITMSRMPCFIRPSDNVISASGYSGHGVAMACLAGRILADSINENSSQFNLFANFETPKFPGGPLFRSSLLALALSWLAIRDRI